MESSLKARRKHPRRQRLTERRHDMEKNTVKISETLSEKEFELASRFVKLDHGWLAGRLLSLPEEVMHMLWVHFLNLCKLAKNPGVENEMDLFTPDKLTRAEKNFENAVSTLKKCIQTHDDTELLELVLYCQATKLKHNGDSRDIFEAVTNYAVQTFTARAGNVAMVKHKTPSKFKMITVRKTA
jgi:hypothetical protein